MLAQQIPERLARETEGPLYHNNASLAWCSSNHHVDGFVSQYLLKTVRD